MIIKQELKELYKTPGLRVDIISINLEWLGHM
jgi:hypothetical protein